MLKALVEKVSTNIDNIKVPCSSQNIITANHKQGDVRKNNQDVAKVRNRPEVAQVDTSQRTADTESSDKDTGQTNRIDYRGFPADTVRGNFRKADHAHQAGKCE